jgi:hypothetical protein
MRSKGLNTEGMTQQGLLAGNSIEIYKTKGKSPSGSDPDSSQGPVQALTYALGNSACNQYRMPPPCAGGVVVVHNGIIENYRELKSHLIASGCEFSSDTDTEVIPHMISSHLKRGLSFYEAVKEVISNLSGTFALGIMSETDPHTIYAVRKEPL